MSDEAKETREAKPTQTRSTKAESKRTAEENEKVDKPYTEMTPEEYSRRFNPVAAYLSKKAAKTEDNK